MNLKSIRKEYKLKSLPESDLEENPFLQFRKWMDFAILKKVMEPTAMSVSTINKNGFPENRIVLLKDFSDEGFTFFTNYSSKKGKAIEETNKVSLHFFWPELEQQIRILGLAKKISTESSDEYFYSRPVASQIGAVVSNQSEEIESRKILEEKYQLVQNKYKGKQIPRPENWGGYFIEPIHFEFWQGRASRLHDRIVYKIENGNWNIKRLAP